MVTLAKSVGRLWLALAVLCGALAVHSCGPDLAHAQYAPVPPDLSHPDTNPRQIRDWFSNIRNRLNGSCCGEGDGYPAQIDVEATPEHDGKGHVIDPSAKEIWAGGYNMKNRPELQGDLTFTFKWDQMVQEKYGNPLDHAIVFLHVEGRRITSVESMPYPNGVYCVVLLPQDS